METNKVYIKSDYQKIISLIADEAKQLNILDEMQSDIKQIRAKSQFRLALLHQIRESLENKGLNK